jgi:DNA-binding response OmpR family regulator
VARILVVDDNDDVRQLVAGVLGEEGHKVQLAADGASALEAMRREAPDVVVLDIMMPEVDGYTVLKTMNDEGLKKRIKVFVLTAKTAENDWVRGYRLGADHYLPKPFTMVELIDGLNSLLKATPEQLRKRRDAEIEKARLLSRLENTFRDP